VTVVLDVCEDMHVGKVDIYLSRAVLQRGKFYWILFYILR
jgi:hypothetical protein